MERLTIYEIPFLEFTDQIRSIVKSVITEELQQLSSLRVNSPPEIKTYTTKEVCELLGITPPTLIKYRREGKIKAKRMGGKIIYTRIEIEKFISSK